MGVRVCEGGGRVSEEKEGASVRGRGRRRGRGGGSVCVWFERMNVGAEEE